MSDVLERARADVAAGRLWKARDRLTGAMIHRPDDALLDLLGEVYHAMGDLPVAGAMWFVSGRTGDGADLALQAWRERHGRDDLELWMSLPKVLRQDRGDAHLQALRKSAASIAAQRMRRKLPVPTGAPERKSSHVFGCIAIGAVVVGVIICFAVGVITLIRWALG